MFYKAILASACALLFCFCAHANSYDDAVSATLTDKADELAPLLEAGLDPNTVTPGGTGESLLLLAIKNHSQNVIRLLLKQPKLNINLGNSLGETPLMIAVYTFNNALAKKLIANGAKINNPKNWSALHYAALNGNKEMIRVLLDHGADVNARTLRGFTPLYMAAREADAETVRMLINAGARKDFCTNDNLAPYDIAKQQQREKAIVKQLHYDYCR